MADVELRSIEAFIALAEELNFRRVAERLYMAQPALSQLIKRLEHEVGATLFYRTTRRVTLSPAGEAFLVEARRAAQAAHAAPRAAREAAAGRIGVVRLGFVGPTAYEVLVTLTAKYRERRPQIRLDVVGPMYSGELADKLAREEIDAALVRLPVSGRRIAVREITRHAMTVAVLADSPYAQRPQVSLHDIHDEPVVSYPTYRGAVVVTAVHSAYMSLGYSPNIVQEAPDTHTVMALVGAGAGIGFVPASAGHIKLPGVVLVPVSDFPPMPLGLAWRANDPNPALRALVSVLDELPQRNELAAPPDP